MMGRCPIGGGKCEKECAAVEVSFYSVINIQSVMNTFLLVIIKITNIICKAHILQI